MSQATTVVCTECKKETTVPFQPTAGRPVYCDDCFKKRRADAPRGGPGGRPGPGGPRGGGGFRGRRESPRQPSFSRSDYPGHDRYK